MYAVIKTGGKQYKVRPGDTIRVEKLPGEPGQEIELTDVLLVAKDDDLKIGQPLVEGAKVIATIVNQGRSKKIIVFKKKRRKNYKKKMGHRQYYTELQIKEISA
ncbi:ribosomal protein L21 [Thermodesulfatator indicus DSM 15286]|uniref:Large ribosomal subunit protein bL21 n=1 Tax=Thermodesulfatator indicus (strain DSM 15286 / JCM 11887 / CIR29812) TaxID=667014 RepID=F8ACW8_THEID|nr:50S ribosomal protein L21 [Thermodesulfatator indicus]AEH44762.1 ribosomal protein L21 [Thermodesulfatator indicus DSM 15286]